jgi:hypothetical protein
LDVITSLYGFGPWLDPGVAGRLVESGLALPGCAITIADEATAKKQKIKWRNFKCILKFLNGEQDTERNDFVSFIKGNCTSGQQEMTEVNLMGKSKPIL